MRKHVKAGLMISILAIFSLYMISSPKVKIDPNVIHVPAPTPQYIKSTIKRPAYNPFNETEVITINRNTNSFYIGEIVEESFTYFEKYSSEMAARGVKTITIHLHSPGGELDVAKLIEQQIKILQERGIKVITVVDDGNACMSACPIIFLAGDEKIAASNSVFMFHAPYVNFPANTSEAEFRFVEHELNAVKVEFSKRLEQTCPTDDSIRMAMFDHTDHFYLASELLSKCSKFFTKVEPASVKDAINGIWNF